MARIYQILSWISLITVLVQCQSLSDKKIIVTTVLERPFTMLRESTDPNLAGNDRFEGYIVDLVEEISKKLGFKYELKLNEDGRYGAMQTNGKWNGMLGELIDLQADIAAAATTITSEREAVVDFTPAFMNAGIGILYKRQNQNGSIAEFQNVEELAAQNRIAYGCIRGGATCSFFRNSSYPTYSKMWSEMSSRDPSPFVSTAMEGIERVQEGGYAFFAESHLIEYVTARNCDLYQVGGLLDSKGFGLAVRQGSPLRELLGRAVLSLQEDGTLLQLKRKWFQPVITC